MTGNHQLTDFTQSFEFKTLKPELDIKTSETKVQFEKNKSMQRNIKG